ncbi:hypothetical protein [Arthrobacter sp. GAS37]|uniref:hypothetical protein n=1 Tax=Arthrobacter sp. GAS37 TaxID=3156261 RepID=UPI00384B1AAC
MTASGVVGLITLGLIVPLAATASADSVAQNTNAAVGTRPMMGFNNWASFQCGAQSRLDGTNAGYSFQQFMEDQGAAMKSLGLVDAGYTNVTVDDCWMAPRNSAGYLHGATNWGSSSQPGFDYELNNYSNYLHGLGELAGLYNTSGETTCQGVASGSQGHQQADANSYAYWGIDSLKLDNCGAVNGATPRQLFTSMAQALNTATTSNPRKVLFNESAPAGLSNASPAKYSTMDWVRTLGQTWRIGPDISLSAASGNGWNFRPAYYEEGAYQSFIDTVQLARYMAPGTTNDPDQLLIGDNGLTVQEERSQFALWR